MGDVIPLPLKRHNVSELPRRERSTGVRHPVPYMHVIETGAEHPQPEYFPVPDPAWSNTTATSWMLGVLKAVSGVTAEVTWSPDGEDRWTVRIGEDRPAVTGLTIFRVWDVIGGAISVAKAMKSREDR